MRYGQLIVIMYSVASRQSFNEVPVFIAQTLRVQDCDNFPMMIVGYAIMFLCRTLLMRRNKCDLVTDEDYCRDVSTQEGLALAKSINVPFIETRYVRIMIHSDTQLHSAKSGVNNALVFHTVFRELMFQKMDYGVKINEFPTRKKEIKHQEREKCLIQ